MGDRCYINLHCRAEHASLFEDFEHDDESIVPGCVCLVNEEGYLDLEDLPKVPFTGSHGSGCSYGPGEFASDGETARYAHTGSEGGYVICFTPDGTPRPGEIEAVRDFIAFEQKCEALLVAMHDPAAWQERQTATRRNLSLTASGL